MEFSREHINFAKAIAQRGKLRLTTRQNRVDQEMDKFFYWIMEQMFSKIEKGWPAKKHNQISLTIAMFNENRIMVQNGRDEIYCVSNVLTTREFSEIIQKMIKFFESIPNYSACYLHDTGSSVARFVINLDV